MTARRVRSIAHRWLAAATLAAYAALGVFGQGLHTLVPCGSDCGPGGTAASHEHCACHHGQAPISHDGEAHGPRLSAAGHDAAHCPLCVLLAKIKSSAPPVVAAEDCVAPVDRALAPGAQQAIDGHLIAWTARGPPGARPRG